MCKLTEPRVKLTGPRVKSEASSSVIKLQTSAFLMPIPSAAFTMEKREQSENSRPHENRPTDGQCGVPKHAPDTPPMPCGHRRDGRNLIVCIDGTSHQFGMKVCIPYGAWSVILLTHVEKNTNVIELYHLILKEADQRTWYNSGIGTYAPPSWKSLNFYKQVLYHKIDLAIAWFVRVRLSLLCSHLALGHLGILNERF